MHAGIRACPKYQVACQLHVWEAKKQLSQLFPSHIHTGIVPFAFLSDAYGPSACELLGQIKPQFSPIVKLYSLLVIHSIWLAPQCLTDSLLTSYSSMLTCIYFKAQEPAQQFSLFLRTCHYLNK